MVTGKTSGVRFFSRYPQSMFLAKKKTTTENKTRTNNVKFVHNKFYFYSVLQRCVYAKHIAILFYM